MTRTLRIEDTTCGNCKQWYETVEEAIDCEAQDDREDAAYAEELSAEDEWWALTEAEYLRSLNEIEFSRP
jgi:hypothetical protein